MFQVLYLVWYMIAILPMFIFLEANERAVKFLGKHGIYWDVWYSLLVVLVILFLVLLMA